MEPSTLPVGRGSAQVLTPAAHGTAVRVGNTRKFRKLILPRMKIAANGRKIDLGKYFRDLSQAERDGAFPAIPLQVAERHSNDPRHTEGQVSNLVHLPEGPDGDGLYADIEFADDKGVDLIRKSLGKVGVSVSMVENLVREEDGQKLSWPAALQHVLMTTDPHVRKTGGGWHPIELGRAEVESTLDLSGTTYDAIKEEPVTAPTQAPPEGDNDGLVALQVTPEQRDSLLALLNQNVTSGRGSEGGEGDSDGDRPDGDPSESPTNLTREDENPALELMRQEIETERQSRLDLERELDAARAANEIDQLGQTGLAPAIIEAARPLLEQPRGAGRIELSRGRSVDPTQIVRNVLHEIIKLSERGGPVLDLDRESGQYVGDQSAQDRRKALLDAWDADFPIVD